MINLEQIRAARALLNIKQQTLAAKAGISIGTLNNIERGMQTDPKVSTIRAIQTALEAEGVEFTQDLPSGGFGLLFRPKQSGRGGTKILIIDDHQADRLLYKNWLSKAEGKNYHILEAGNARTGHEAFLHHQPDCIILDFMMYGKNGFQLLTEMKQGKIEMPPIIFVTAMHSDAVEKDAKSLGVQTYLNKNQLIPDLLCAAVANAIARSHLKTVS